MMHHSFCSLYVTRWVEVGWACSLKQTAFESTDVALLTGHNHSMIRMCQFLENALCEDRTGNGAVAWSPTQQNKIGPNLVASPFQRNDCEIAGSTNMNRVLSLVAVIFLVSRAACLCREDPHEMRHECKVKELEKFRAIRCWQEILSAFVSALCLV